MVNHRHLFLLGLSCASMACGFDSQDEPVVVDIYCYDNQIGKTPEDTSYCIDHDDDMTQFIEEFGHVTKVGGLHFSNRATNADVLRTRETSLVRVGNLSISGDSNSTKGLENIIEVDAFSIDGPGYAAYDLSGLTSLKIIRRGMGIDIALKQRELVLPPALETIGIEEQYEGTGLYIGGNESLETIDLGQLRAASWITITNNRNLKTVTRSSTEPFEIVNALYVDANAKLTNIEALTPDIKPKICSINENTSLSTCHAKRVCEGVDEEHVFVEENAPDSGC